MFCVREVSVDLSPGSPAGDGSVIELAVVAEGQAVLEGVVPNEAGRGEGQRVVAEGITANEAAERFLQVVGVVGLGAPGMAVG